MAETDETTDPEAEQTDVDAAGAPAGPETSDANDASEGADTGEDVGPGEGGAGHPVGTILIAFGFLVVLAAAWFWTYFILIDQG